MSSDGVNLFEKWYPNCEFDAHNIQKGLANIFINLFETFIADKDNLMSREEHLQACRPQGGPLVIFNQHTLGNSDLWATSLE